MVPRLASRRVAQAVLALVVAIGLLACGGSDGGGSALTRAAFTARAEAQCSRLKRASEAVRAKQDPNATGKRVAEYFRENAANLRTLVRGLEPLTPPADIRRDVDSLRSLLRRYADGLGSLATKVGTEDSVQTVLNANGRTVTRLNTFADRATTLVARLGLAGCILTA